jgi:ABC-type uncharacterized transport system involved in gliding motility auxiliary subunit
MNGKRLSRTTLYYMMLIALVIFVALNLVANRMLESSRLDLTENHLFTLSEGTKQVLSTIDEPLTMRFFYSEKASNGYPIIQNYAARMKGMLKQYAALSKGKLKLQIIDPEPFSEEEDLAVAQSVRGVEIDTAGNKLFFGMSIANSVDEIQAIPFFSPDRQAFIEYDVTRLIDRLSHASKTKVGIISWLPMRGTPQSLAAGQGPWAVFEQMQEFFDLDVLKVDADVIPADINVLVVAHPTVISDQTLYAIDQYMIRGGKAVFLVDPNTEIPDVAEKRSSLEPLLSHWGVRMNEQYVAGDMQAAIRVNTGDDVSALGGVPNISWLLLKKPTNFNQQDLLSAELNTMVMPSVGILESVEGATTTMTPIITTGESSFYVDQRRLMFARENPTILMENLKPADNPLVIAAKVSGPITSAFPDRKDEKHLAASKEPASFVVVADTDFLRDGFWVQKQKAFGTTLLTPSADNGAFLLNAIDYLSGNSALFSLRTRTTDDRRFDKVDALRREAEEHFRAEEERLRQNLRKAESQLSELQSEEEGASLLSKDQQSKLEAFRDVMVETRRELRQVQHELRRDIESLGSRLKLIHIGLIPLIVLLLGLWLPRRLGMKRT